MCLEANANRFMKLPLDVRLMIYDSLIPAQTPIFYSHYGRHWSNDGSHTEDREQGLATMISLARTCRSLECLFRLFSRLTFFFDNPRKACTFLGSISEDALRYIHGVHVSYHGYSEQDAEVDIATHQTESPPHQMPLRTLLVQTSQSLNAGVAIGRAEALDPELAEIVARRLGRGAQAEISSARDSLCLQACILNVGVHELAYSVLAAQGEQKERNSGEVDQGGVQVVVAEKEERAASGGRRYRGDGDIEIEAGGAMS
ncbi:hypothetical protein Purlil1_13567 [Purpureocillium lilacinum]|uniref:Uncharacterized protein n=1 Tax=Purpureocillium lilacinum TaxID=33203 RepID=A0ABR0BE07_PURLI|nr:hypothetical protein Purlil1_13567 [Purpureocillium lilacinum]